MVANMYVYKCGRICICAKLYIHSCVMYIYIYIYSLINSVCVCACDCTYNINKSC